MLLGRYVTRLGYSDRLTFRMMLVLRLPLLALFLLPAIGYATVTITWRDNSTNEQGFIIERALGTGAFQQVAKVGSNVTTYRDNEVITGLLHRYRVCAYNQAGRSAYTNVVEQDLTPALPLPGIAGVSDFVLAVNQSKTVDLPVSQVNLRDSSVRILATSSNATTVPHPRVEVAGSAVRLSIQPASGSTGKSTITVAVSNGQRIAYQRFNVTVGSGSATVARSTARLRLINLSARARVGTGEDVLAVGFALRDAEAQLLLRGVGPGLIPYIGSSALELPVLTLFQSGTRLLGNFRWGGAYDMVQAALASGAFPLLGTSRDAALLKVLRPGDYSAEVSTAGEPGVALAELYQVPGDSYRGTLVNLSARANVHSDAELVMGFSLQGEGKQRLLIRAAGPSLQKFGVTRALSNPRITFYRGSHLVMAADGYALDGDLIEASFAVGAFPLTYTSEVAFLVTLEPGVYSAVVSSTNGSSGVSLGEIYVVP